MGKKKESNVVFMTKWIVDPKNLHNKTLKQMEHYETILKFNEKKTKKVA